MALKAILDNLDGLPADVAKEYKKNETTGKYVLDVTPTDGMELAEVSKLQSALSKERENNRKVNDQLKAFEGIESEKAREALKKVGEMSNWTPEQKVQEKIDSVKAQLLDAHGKEKTALESRLKNLTKQLESAMIISVATQALAEQKGSVKLLMPHIEKKTRLREADGKFIVEVLDENGTPRTFGTDGHFMSINELIAEMKTQTDYASAFEGTGSTGSGATGGSTTVTGKTIKASEKKAIEANIDKIASGEIKVVE